MIRSMTTYCRMEEEREGWRISLELRAVNSRFLDLHLRAPRWLLPLEERIRSAVRAALERGRVELSLVVEGELAPAPTVEPDRELARAYLRALEGLAAELGLPAGLDLPALLALNRDLVRVEEQEQDLEEVWRAVAPVLEGALAQAREMAQREGENLAADLRRRLDHIEDRIGAIESAASGREERLLERLRRRMAQIIVDIPLDEARLLQEAALMADRLDITEELVRARSHIAQFRSLFQEDGPVGRTMDFLLQELFREVNTVASKCQDSEISHMVVDIKAELEKMREQVQNIV